MKRSLFSSAAALVMMAAMAPGALAATEIHWWHSMGGALGEKLEEVAATFNASQADWIVVPVNKGTYAESMTAAIAAFRAGEAPHILQVFEVGTGTFMTAGEAIYPVHQLMADHGRPFDPAAFLPAVTGYYSDPNGNMLSFPFNSSSVILYYNKDIFTRAGLDPNVAPATWDDVAAAGQQIVASGAAACGFTTTWPSWVNVENFSAWHNIPIATEMNGMAGTDAVFQIDNELVARHWQNLVEWQAAGVYSYGGRGSDAGAKFRSGECGMMLESSAGRASLVANTAASIGFGMMPYYADVEGAPQNSIIGGASLWVFADHPEAEYEGVAAFFDYLSQPEVQADWHQFTGYLPITTAAYELTQQQGFYAANPGADMAIREVNLNPPTENSRGLRFGNFVQIRAMFEEELEAALNGTKTVSEALASAQDRGNQMLREFAAQ
jgi:sn-glycerol 3-phosphate transport system substrate-binding protein